MLHQLEHALLAGRREGPVNIDLPQSFSQIAIHVAHAAPPARLHLLYAEECSGEKIEIFVNESIAQRIGAAVEHLPSKVNLPMLERMPVQHDLRVLEEVRGGHDVVRSRRCLDKFQVAVPIEGGCERFYLR